MSCKDVNVMEDEDIIELTSNLPTDRQLSLSSDGPLYDKKKRKESVTSLASTSSSRSRKFLGFTFKNSKSGSTNGSVRRRWRSIRHAVRVTNAVSMRKGISREDSFLKKFSTRQPYRADSIGSLEENTAQEATKNETSKKISVLHPDGNTMFYWLGIVTIAVMYNLWTCIAREAFREIQQGHVEIWIAFDILCDTVFIIDIIVQFRTGYLDQGIMVYDSSKLAQKYISSRLLFLDLLCLMPLDFLQFYVGVHSMLRFPRFIKAYRTFRFMYMLESRTQFPNFFRVANLTHILFLGSHWFAAFYYLISEAENFEGDWSYPKPVGQFASVTRKYLASLFWSTLTLTTIGDLPPPESNWEYVFVIVSYLIGVFIFATIVGQVGNVITNRNASRQEFERLLDGAKMYMRMNNVPPELQKRVQRWYDYVWTRGRMKGSDINSLGLLPDKLKTELAIHVNLETLKKVTIFQECQPEFLHDLVLKMKAYIFTPGDLICRRGEVAREMFIIADGLVEIISESGTVLTQMGTGDFFGEIGILNLDGGINRRTADVKSVGYSELFVLSREDVLSALKDHPEAEQIIREYGQQRLKAIEQHRQKMKESNSTNLISKQKWSPSSPCKHFHAEVSPKRKRKSSSSQHSGIKLSDISINLPPISKQKSGIFNAMKTLVSKTKDKRQNVHLKSQSSVNEDETNSDWPVIARLTQGEVLADKSQSPKSRDKILNFNKLNKISSEITADSTKHQFMMSDKRAYHISSHKQKDLNSGADNVNMQILPEEQDKDLISSASASSSTNLIHGSTLIHQHLTRNIELDKQHIPIPNEATQHLLDMKTHTTPEACCCPHIKTQILSLQQKLENFDNQYARRLDDINQKMDKQSRFLENIFKQKLLTDTTSTSTLDLDHQCDSKNTTGTTKETNTEMTKL